jgi:hypothetical protein
MDGEKYRAPSSGDQSDPPRLRFRTRDDTLDFLHHVSEDGDNWLAANNINFAERYEKGEVVVVLELSAGAHLSQYHLIFSAVPPKGARVGYLRRPCDETTPAGDLKERNADLNQGLVFCHIAALVQCPNKVVPSFVWFEPAKERQDIRRNIFAASPTYNIRFKLCGAVGNRKVRILGIRSPSQRRANVAHLIQRRAQSLKNLHGERRKLGRNALNKLALVNCANSVRVSLFNASVGVSFEEFGNPPIKITDVLLCAANPLFGASKGIDFFHSEPPLLHRSLIP